MMQMVEYLYCKHETLSSNLIPMKMPEKENQKILKRKRKEVP
jgi:hypothetical protein